MVKILDYYDGISREWCKVLLFKDILQFCKFFTRLELLNNILWIALNVGIGMLDESQEEVVAKYVFIGLIFSEYCIFRCRYYLLPNLIGIWQFAARYFEAGRSIVL